MYSTFQTGKNAKLKVAMNHDEEENESLLDVPFNKESSLFIDEPKGQQQITYRLMYSFAGLFVVGMLAIYWAISHHQSNSTYATSSSSDISKTLKTMKDHKSRASNKPKLIDKPQKTGAASADHPNIVLLLIDDLGFGTIGYDSTSEYSNVIPHMTKLFETGVTFENYYSQEVCTPSRAALLTGRMPISIGMQFGVVAETSDWGMNTSEILLPEVLKDYGDYTNVMLGKWHLGHWQPQYLPTARGFDYSINYLAADEYYWSKHSVAFTYYYDMLYADTTCYHAYDNSVGAISASDTTASDISDYSTFFYGNKAQAFIESHDFDDTPMFLYLAVQAVHDPFEDVDNTTEGSNGIPMEYVGEEIFNTFAKQFPGGKRLQQMLSLYLLDQYVGELVATLKSIDQYDNTIFFVASDNGGCYQSGGRNGGLRGCKGTLFEGGTRVDAFLHSPLLPTIVQGSRYYGLTHVTDVFPTLLDFVGIDYNPSGRHRLDGVSHYDAILASAEVSAASSISSSHKSKHSSNTKTSSSNTSPTTFTSVSYPREYVLYNIWFKYVYSTSVWQNSTFAIRNNQYKFMHAYANNTVSQWYSEEQVVSDDDNMNRAGTCSQTSALDGDGATYFLFDLMNDPNETNNLYTTDSSSEYYNIIIKLTNKLQEYVDNNLIEETRPSSSNPDAAVEFDKVGYLVPWDFTNTEFSAPSYCRPSSTWFHA